MKGLAQCCRLQEARDAEAARGIGLQHVDRTGLEHPAKIGGRVAILPGSDRHAGGRPVTHQPKPLEIVGGHRLLEPAHVMTGEALGQGQRLLAIIAPFASTKSSAAGPIVSRASRTRSGSSPGCAPTFIFTRPTPLSTQPPSCSASRSGG